MTGQIRVNDFDDKKRWAAIIPTLWPGRRPMELRIENPDRLVRVVTFVGDVIVDEVRDEDGNWVPERYELIALYETDREPGLYTVLPSAPLEDGGEGPP